MMTMDTVAELATALQAQIARADAAIAERDTLKGELREAVADHIEAVKNTDEARRWVDELEAERDAARAEAAELRDRLNATCAELRKVSDQGVSARLDRAEARADAIVLREQVAWMRSVAQDALDNDTGEALIYAPLYQQALEDIVSEEQDDNSSHVAP